MMKSSSRNDWNKKEFLEFEETLRRTLTDTFKKKYPNGLKPKPKAPEPSSSQQSSPASTNYLSFSSGGTSTSELDNINGDEEIVDDHSNSFESVVQNVEDLEAPEEMNLDGQQQSEFNHFEPDNSRTRRAGTSKGSMYANAGGFFPESRQEDSVIEQRLLFMKERLKLFFMPSPEPTNPTITNHAHLRSTKWHTLSTSNTKKVELYEYKTLQALEMELGLLQPRAQNRIIRNANVYGIIINVELSGIPGARFLTISDDTSGDPKDCTILVRIHKTSHSNILGPKLDPGDIIRIHRATVQFERGKMVISTAPHHNYTLFNCSEDEDCDDANEEILFASCANIINFLDSDKQRIIELRRHRHRDLFQAKQNIVPSITDAEPILDCSDIRSTQSQGFADVNSKRSNEIEQEVMSDHLNLIEPIFFEDLTAQETQEFSLRFWIIKSYFDEASDRYIIRVTDGTRPKFHKFLKMYPKDQEVMIKSNDEKSNEPPIKAPTIDISIIHASENTDLTDEITSADGNLIVRYMLTRISLKYRLGPASRRMSNVYLEVDARTTKFQVFEGQDKMSGKSVFLDES